MTHPEGDFPGPRGIRIRWQGWVPEGHPRAVLLLVHGLAEHSGRYGNLVNHFLPLGYAVYGVDHVGHGKSEGARVFVEGFAEFLGPLDTLFGMVRERHPGVPVFVVGHSMGGLIAATWLLGNQDTLAGAILSGPSVKVPDNLSTAVILVGRLLSRLIPGAGVVGLDAHGISRDPAVVQAYLDDPLVYKGKITARLGAELLQAMQRIGKEARRIRLPILILQGDADQLVDPLGARILHGLAGSQDKTLKVYDGLYHELYNEPERGQVLEDVGAWLAARGG